MIFPIMLGLTSASFFSYYKIIFASKLNINKEMEINRG